MNRTQTYQFPKGKTKNGIIPVPIIVNGTNTHNSGDVAKQGSVRFNALGIVPFVKKIFTKKESQPLASAPRPLPEGELVVSFYDSAKELLSTETFALTKENQWETLSFETKTEEKGYVSAKIQGTSATAAHFDNFTILLGDVHYAKLYQENHYYPFGMNMKGLESSDKQTQQNKKEHEWQYNGRTEKETSFDLYWNITNFRTYDYQLGRFHQIDPLTEYFTGINGYNYAFNNPVSFNDPTGLAPEGDGLRGIWERFKDLFRSAANKKTPGAKCRNNRKQKVKHKKRNKKRNRPTDPTPPPTIDVDPPTSVNGPEPMGYISFTPSIISTPASPSAHGRLKRIPAPVEFIAEFEFNYWSPSRRLGDDIRRTWQPNNPVVAETQLKEIASSYTTGGYRHVLITLTTSNRPPFIDMPLNTRSTGGVPYPSTWGRTSRTIMWNRAFYIRRKLIEYGVPASAFDDRRGWFILNTGRTTVGNSVKVDIEY